MNVQTLPGLSVADITGAGAQRISVGGGLAWVGVEAVAAAAVALRDNGDLEAMAADPPLDEWFAGN